MAAFNGSGTFVRSYDFTTDRDAGIKILADRMDTELDGLATGLSTVICKDGQTTATARIPFIQGISLLGGAVGTPSIIPTGDTDTGIWFSAADKVSISCGGTKIVEATTAGFDVTGALTATGNITITKSTPALALVGSEGSAKSISIYESAGLLKFDWTGNQTLLSLDGATGNAAVTGTLTSTAHTITSISASALTVGRLGATTPALLVDASTATSITGVKVKSAATGGGVAVSAVGETNVNLTIDAAGSGTITLGGTSTGAITLTRATTLSAALTYGGVALSNAVTGTGNMVLSASPTFTGTVTAAALSPSGDFAINTNKFNVTATTGALATAGNITMTRATPTITLAGSEGSAKTAAIYESAGVLGIDWSGNQTVILIDLAGNGTTFSVGGLILGAATGGHKGTGTLNTAGAIYTNNTQVISSAGAATFTTGSFSGALTYGGVTLSSSVTGTGSMALSASPTFTGTVTTPNLTVTSNLVVTGTTLGFFGATALTRQSVGGSRGGGAALQNLLTTLSTIGIINDTSVA